MIYLASPYTHPNQEVEEKRYDDAVHAVAEISKTGKVVYSPIVHFHVAATRFQLPTDFSFWSRINLDMIERSDQLWVLMLDGWEYSVGVREEINFARGTGKVVKMEDPCSWLR